ncbi:sigma factor-like helix-turn-helix DNA-binding protein [Streptomyces winkii]|uniref:sigma factor-like helix-turn-helix DNA-binding protein n=1 Tax=Streptomyces winkii TaxID=3051178 RepID=UPI0028D4BDF8|nr:sigma factor-like helix-turn-helix DNA-binding protein [Streptomyces sp. DSM 40971]
MAQMYTEGATLAEIGSKYGISRERVRQVLQSKGSVTAEESRQARRRAREADLNEKVGEFLSQHRSTIEGLAAAGTPRSEVEERFRLVHPEVPAAIVKQSIMASSVLFDVDYQEFNFPVSAVESALWYALARELDLKADRATAIEDLDLAEAREVSDALSSEQLAPETVATVLCLVSAAREYARKTPVGLSAQRYNRQRVDILRELGLESKQGATPWPPTSQTVMKRLGAGSWADAQLSVGLSPDRRGRPRGLLVFREEDYELSVKKFMEYAAETGQSATFAVYGAWVEAEERAGRRWPSAPSIRFHYRNWMAAKRAASASTGAAAQRSLRGSVAPVGTLALHHFQKEITAFLTKLEGLHGTETSEAIRNFIKPLMTEFEFRRRSWIRASVLRDPTAICRRLDDPTLKAKHRVALTQDPPDIDSVLTDMYLDRLGNGDPRVTDGWLRPDAQAELDSISDETVLQYSALREIRNYLTHISQESTERLGSALRRLSEVDPRFELNQPLTARVLLSWLSSTRARRLQLLLTCVPSIWRAMVVGEALTDESQ